MVKIEGIDILPPFDPLAWGVMTAAAQVLDLYGDDFEAAVQEQKLWCRKRGDEEGVMIWDNILESARILRSHTANDN